MCRYCKYYIAISEFKPNDAGQRRVGNSSLKIGHNGQDIDISGDISHFSAQ